VLIRRAITLVEEMNALTLVMVIRSLSSMDIINRALLNKARNVLLISSGRSGPIDNQE